MHATPSRHSLLAARLSRVQSALRKAKGGDARALSTLRTGIRRLRDVLPMLQLDSRIIAKADKGLRKAATRLKPITRIDALLMLSDELTPASRSARSADSRIKQELRARRTKLAVSSATTRASARVLKAIARLKVAAAHPTVAHETLAVARARRWAVKARATRRATELKRLVAEAGAVYVPGRLKSLRRAARGMLRAGDLLADLGVRINPADLRTLAQVTRSLDGLRDAEALIARVRKLQGVFTPADLKAWKELEELIVPLENRCRQLHGAYMRDREALALAADRLGARAAVGARRQKAS